MISQIRILLAAVAVAALAGCAHPIVIAPDFSDVRTPAAPASAKNAAYYISNEDRSREITTPGGGGDKVRYYPYRDLEAGLYKVLGTSFASVTKLERAPEGEALRAQNIALVVIPKITTHSSSDSILTWPPTSFSVELECRLTDPTGAEIAKTQVTGFGNAEFSEFKSDFGLAAKRASTDALNKLSDALGRIDALKQ